MSDIHHRNEAARSQMLYDANRKSTGVAYLLWFFLGMFGAHRFYLGETGSGVAQLVLSIIGWVTTLILIGFFILAAVGIWVLVDAFLIPGMIRSKNTMLADSLTR
jgi:TM2 domain-containing membrane protein YozV